MAPFVARQRKHKVRVRKNQKSGEDVVGTNEALLIPQSLEEKEGKRRILKAELRATQPHVSSKKQKRLDKYIEKKLKKDETSELLKRLSADKFDTSQLRSSKNLGKRKRGRISNNIPSIDAEEEAVEGLARIDGGPARSYDSEDSYLDSLQGPSVELFDGTEGQNAQRSGEASKNHASQGSGLKDPLQIDADGHPLIYTRKKKVRRKAVSEDSWEGFDDYHSNDLGEKSIQNTVKATYGGTSFGTIEDESESEQTSEDQSTDATRSVDSGQDPAEESDRSSDGRKAAQKSSTFKLWALQQVNKSVGHVPFQATNYTEGPKATSTPVKSSMPESFTNIHTAQEHQIKPEEKAYSVLVSRSAEVEELRSQLPIVAEEQKIMEAIHDHECVIVWGTTGSGKTTQVPQFLYEAGYGSSDGPTPGMIGVTQPRRVAAVSMARRVSEELGEHGEKVSHQIRFESTASKKTVIKFMTDGILLREITRDFALTKYSVIIVDEAHERSVNTDILIGMLSRIVGLRRKIRLEDATAAPLKLVIMSATLRISDFLQQSNLFPSGPPPLVQAEGRVFPVIEHFSRHTPRDYLEEVFRKVSRGHRKLPPGGMLVFLTGQNEIKDLLKRLQEVFPSSNKSLPGSTKVQILATEAPLETDDLELDVGNSFEAADEETDVVFFGHDAEDKDDEFDIGDAAIKDLMVHILPLYSQLPTQEQLRVFQPPPEGARSIVLATNVAETSLTIPGIRYVFDCGRSKERVYDPSTGVQQFEVGWISKSSAAQRAGRAGRTGPGHCYRLYSSAVYERDFVQHSEPEILRTPIESVVLQLKTMGIDNVVNFPFPTAPERSSLVKADNLLRNIGALNTVGQVTPLGRSLCIYPVSPRYGKMLAIGSQHGCLPYVISLVSALAVGDIFIPESQLDLHPRERDNIEEIHNSKNEVDDIAREHRRKSYNRARAILSKSDPSSDALRLLSAVCAAAYEEDNLEGFCLEMFCRSKAVREISQLRKQLSDLVRANNPQILGPFNPRLPSPSGKQAKALNQIVAAAFIDQVAMRADLSPAKSGTGDRHHRKPKRAIDVPYLCRSQPTTTTGAHQQEANLFYIHPSSLLARLPPTDLPQYLIYSHLQQSAPSVVIRPSEVQNGHHHHHHHHHYPQAAAPPKIRIHPLTPVSGPQISALAHDTPILSYGKPIGKVNELRAVDGGGGGGGGDGGPLSGERRECWVVPSLRLDSNGSGSEMGWPLPARKVVQRRDVKGRGRGGDGWVVERFLT